MIQKGRLAVGRHRTGVADTVFIGMRRDAGHLLALARRQGEIDLRTPGLHRELAHVSGRRRAQKGHGFAAPASAGRLPRSPNLTAARRKARQ